jgi:hypothetical protein
MALPALKSSTGLSSTETLRRGLDGELEGMRTARLMFWNHWRELATYILPRRYKWLITANDYRRGSMINGMILDASGTIAARRLASGLMSGITSPTRPWFKLRIPGISDHETDAASLWLAEVERRMMRVFSESNFYTSMGTVYFDLVVFGTACNIIYEDYHDVIRCYTPCLGEYFLANDSKLRVGKIAREFVYTVQQTVDEFGIENCSMSVQNLYKTESRTSLEQEVVICHMIRPKGSKWEEVYWEKGSSQTECLRQKDFEEWPACCPRWDLTGNDAYGRSPGMDALGDIKQLQQETKRKGQAIDKMTNPPMVADIQLKNQPASMLPGGVTFVSGIQQGRQLFAPAYQIMPPVQELMQDIAQITDRIGQIFFNDLFMMISNLETVRTATEIDARREEKLVQLGPVLERFENEALDPAITRTFNIMLRAGLLPEAPPEIAGVELQIQYVSMLAEAQRATQTAGIERLFAFAGNLAGIRPDVLDNLNFDEGVDQYGNALNVDPRIIFSQEVVAQQRAQRAQQMQEAQQQQQMAADVNAAKLLSETQVGGGINALQAMTG